MRLTETVTIAALLARAAISTPLNGGAQDLGSSSYEAAAILRRAAAPCADPKSCPEASRKFWKRQEEHTLVRRKRNHAGGPKAAAQNHPPPMNKQSSMNRKGNAHQGNPKNQKIMQAQHGGNKHVPIFGGGGGGGGGGRAQKPVIKPQPLKKEAVRLSRQVSKTFMGDGQNKGLFQQGLDYFANGGARQVGNVIHHSISAAENILGGRNQMRGQGNNFDDGASQFERRSAGPLPDSYLVDETNDGFSLHARDAGLDGNDLRARWALPEADADADADAQNAGTGKCGCTNGTKCRCSSGPGGRGICKCI